MFPTLVLYKINTDLPWVDRDSRSHTVAAHPYVHRTDPVIGVGGRKWKGEQQDSVLRGCGEVQVPHHSRPNGKCLSLLGSDGTRPKNKL